MRALTSQIPVARALLCGATVAAALAGPVSPAQAISGGDQVSAGTYPWLVRISWQGSDGVCSGALVGARHVITAAHCAPKTVSTSGGRYVVFQNATGSAAGQRIAVVRSERHPDGRDDASRTDLSLWTLASRAPVAPVALVRAGDSRFERFGVRVTATGYGVGDGSGPPRARQIAMRATNGCARSGPAWLCATTGDNSTGIRPGDSGGPLVVRTSAYGGTRYLVLGTASNHSGGQTWFARLSSPRINSWLRARI